jgi:hypothetical protein
MSGTVAFLETKNFKEAIKLINNFNENNFTV